MRQLIILVLLSFLPLSYTFSQCYTEFAVTNSSADLDCDGGVSLSIDYASGSGTGNACFILDYFDIAGNAQNIEYMELSGPGFITVADIDCTKGITFTPKTAPNCNGNQCSSNILPKCDRFY